MAGSIKIIDSEIFTKPAVEAEIMLKYGLIDGIKNSWDMYLLTKYRLDR